MVGFMRVMKFSFAMLERSHADLLALCREVDLVIVSHTAAGSIEADQLGLPTVSVTLMPQAIPANDPKDSVFKRAVMKAAGAGMGLVMTRPLNQIASELGLADGPDRSPPRPQPDPVAPCPPARPALEPRHRMTGYWFAPAPANWPRPPT
jgi:hypothetical protein